jgi:hypothetical protein
MLRANFGGAAGVQLVDDKGAEKAATACPEHSQRAGDDHAFVAPERAAVGPGLGKGCCVWHGASVAQGRFSVKSLPG